MVYYSLKVISFCRFGVLPFPPPILLFYFNHFVSHPNNTPLLPSSIQSTLIHKKAPPPPYTKPTDRPFQNTFRPLDQLGSTNPGPSGR